MASSTDTAQLPGLRAWEIQRRNQRRRVITRAILSVVTLALLTPLLPDAVNPLVYAGTHSAADTPAIQARRAQDVAAVIAQRADPARTRRLGPPLSDAPPTALPAPTHAAAEMLCLTKAVYFEARGESLEGQIAVAQVVLNRVRSTGTSICQTVYKGVERGEKCQFSFACYSHDLPSDTSQLWQQAQWVADEVATGRAWLREIDKSEHYHTAAVAPIWRLALKPVRRIGQHIFYVPPGTPVDLTLARKLKPRWDEPPSYSWADAIKPQHEAVTTVDIKAPKPVAIKKTTPTVTPVRSEGFNPFAGGDQR